MKFPLAPRSRAQSVQVPPPAYVGEPIVAVHCDAGVLWMPASDGVMKPFIESRGTWEPEEGALLRDFFKPGLRFLDVGANLGYFSLLVDRECPGAEIHAFEPHPMTSRLLALNAWGSGGNIEVHPVALSSDDRLLAVTTAEHNLGDTRTRADGHATMLAPAISLDEALPGAVFDLVKIDVQGFEAEVIGGMLGMIKRSPQVVIVAEFWPMALRERGLDPVKVLRAYRDMGLELRVQIADDIVVKPPVELVRICDRAGEAGQLNLILTPKA